MPFDRTESRQQETDKLINADGNKALAPLNQELEDAKNIAKENLTNARARGENLDVLNNQTATLAESSSQFKRRATHVNSLMRREYRNCMIRLALAGFFIVSAVVIALVIHFRHH